MRPAIELLRSKQAEHLTEHGIVERKTGETTTDPDTGSTVYVVETVFDGPCLVRPQYRISAEEVGGTTVVVGRYDVMLPADTAVVRNDVLKVTSAPYDPTLEGVEFKLLDVPLDAWQIARYCTGERFT